MGKLFEKAIFMYKIRIYQNQYIYIMSLISDISSYLGIKMNFYKFSKSTTVVVADCLSITKGFHEWISCNQQQNIYTNTYND